MTRATYDWSSLEVTLHESVAAAGVYTDVVLHRKFAFGEWSGWFANAIVVKRTVAVMKARA